MAVHHPAGNGLAPKHRGRPLVLVAHVSPTVRQALLVTLDLLGFDVLVTADGLAALALLTDLQPRVVVTDPDLWDSAGEHLLDRLQPDDTGEGIPIVVFGRSTGQTRATDFSVNGVHHLRSQDGVSRLVDLLFQLTDSAGTDGWPAGNGSAA